MLWEGSNKVCCDVGTGSRTGAGGFKDRVVQHATGTGAAHGTTELLHHFQMQVSANSLSCYTVRTHTEGGTWGLKPTVQGADTQQRQTIDYQRAFYMWVEEDRPVGVEVSHTVKETIISPETRLKVLIPAISVCKYCVHYTRQCKGLGIFYVRSVWEDSWRVCPQASLNVLSRFQGIDLVSVQKWTAILTAFICHFYQTTCREWYNKTMKLKTLWISSSKLFFEEIQSSIC